MKKWLLALADWLDWPILTMQIRKRVRSAKGIMYVPVVAITMSVLSIVYVLLNAKTAGDRRECAAACLTVALLLRAAYALVIVPMYCSRTIASEREAGRFDSLAITPMSSRAIAMQSMALPVILALVVQIVLLPSDVLSVMWLGASRWYILLGPLAFLGVTSMIATMGVHASCCCGNSRGAAVVSVVGAFGFMLPLWMLFRMCGAARELSIEPAMLIEGVYLLFLVLFDIALIAWGARDMIRRLDRLRRAI